MNDISWIDLGSVEAAAALIECRSCAVDHWWTSWNLASTGLVLEGEILQEISPVSTTKSLSVESVDIENLPEGLAARRLPGEIRFVTPYLHIGFRLRSANLSFFGLDERGREKHDQNLLALPSALGIGAIRPQCSPYVVQGPRLHTVGAHSNRGFAGSVRFDANRVRYRLWRDSVGLSYELEWEILPDRLILRAARTLEIPLRAWDSGVWHMAFDGLATASPAALGAITQQGQTGLMKLPVLLHWPGRGTLCVAASGDGVLLRSDCLRSEHISTAELKLNERPQDEGDYVLPPGTSRAEFAFALQSTITDLSPSAPPAVAQAIQRCALSGLAFRADTATLSNNAQSIHSPMCMDTWSVLASRLRTLPDGLDATDFLRCTLDRWLDGGPGYGSGKIACDESGSFEDEYLMSGTAALLGLAHYLSIAGNDTRRWMDAQIPAIARQLTNLRRRDVDKDGLIESERRQGVSGSHQWSTCWYDVISFGWKDAFSNALLYQALVTLNDALLALGNASLVDGLLEWAQELRKSYQREFWNPQTNWLAGWRCRQRRLHDYGFLFVNGAAVCAGLIEKERAQQAIGGLWQELCSTGFNDFRLGLPGNVWIIPPEDLAEPQASLPDGVYQNRGATHSQSRHFVGAMYRVGLVEQADRVLNDLCASLADGSAFGGCGSGVDWRCWDGSPCGYEGLLSDQFGILAVAMDRYGAIQRRDVP